MLGKVNCANAPLPNGQRLADRPDVPNPPSPQDPDGRPRVCRQDHTNHRLILQLAKRLQGFIHGSHLWDDYYNTMRSANERFHSALKNPHGSGVRKREWLQVRGRAKVTLALAIATAANNHNMLEAFHSNQMDANGKPKFPPREFLRRARRTLLKQHGT